MPNKNDDRKLLFYIIVSIILHLLILYFLPIGFLHGSAQSESDLNDYGYVQLVDFQPAPIEDNTSEKAKELTDETEEEELQEEDKEAAVEETSEEESNEQAVEEKLETDVEEKIKEESELIEEIEEDPIPEPEQKPEVESEPEPEAEAETKESETEIIASEESESEVEVIQEEESSKNELDVEENKNQKTNKETTVTEENQEIKDTVKEEKTSPPPPPPPPASGDLIGLIETPTFPKDLVGSRSEGTVSLMVEVMPGGTVNNIEIIESSGHDSMDRIAQLTVKHGWQFKEYQQKYKIPISVKYYIDKSDNSQVEVDIGQVNFISGGE